ncbi:MAG: hypothetical protein GY716_18655 [bacterium]|nr:hypothetical protein [bacterium]
MRIGAPCNFRQTSREFSNAEGPCTSGLIIDSNTDPQPIRLTLEFTMQFRRARPVDLPPTADFDGDFAINSSDNCPLISNPDQQDTNLDGVGDACTSSDGRQDSDADGVRDSIDNCVWINNPDQENTQGLSSKGTSDGIGDACEDQLLRVTSMGTDRIRVELEFDDFVQPLGLASLILVDFDHDEILDALCDWDAGSCEVNADALRLCSTTSAFSASLGCPEEEEKE